MSNTTPPPPGPSVTPTWNGHFWTYWNGTDWAVWNGKDWVVPPKKKPASTGKILAIILGIVAVLMLLALCSSGSDAPSQGKQPCPPSLNQNDGGAEALSDAFMRGFNDCE